MLLFCFPPLPAGEVASRECGEAEGAGTYFRLRALVCP